ncbi:unnamed protein product [Xylocopa violacea]|uniref:WKF domain-containing protein n=1 Tax=Xylocopa violacea TaxID=135666 RepID=A0ABP1N5M0_XYLVO
MGSDGTSKFEVKNPKSRKRTKIKYKSKDVTNTTSRNIDTWENDTDNIEELNRQNMKHRKRKDKKQKSNTISDASQEVTESNEEENNFAELQKNQDEEGSSDEETPPKKKTNRHIESNLDDTEESNKTDAKTPKQPSKRQLKREKAEKKENEKKMASKMEAMKKGLNYVSKWKYARSEWKFEKLRQIWLIDNLLDETSIPDDIFPTVLEYFEGCKGMAREQLLKKGMDVIRKVEEDEENKDEMESIAYQRARKLLQALPTET